MNRRDFLIGGAAACASLGFREIAWASAALIGEASSGYFLRETLPATSNTNTSINWGAGEGGRLVAGRFTAGGTYRLTKVGFYVHAITGSPSGTSTCAIYSKTGDTASTDTPNASLATSTSSISAYAADTWIEFKFAGLALTSGEKYWAIAQLTAHDEANYASLRYDADPTTSQRVMNSDDDPISWINKDTSAQLWLRLYSGG